MARFGHELLTIFLQYPRNSQGVFLFVSYFLPVRLAASFPDAAFFCLDAKSFENVIYLLLTGRRVAHSLTSNK